MEKKSCCAGSCYLNKQLKENEEKQEATPLNEKQRVEYVSDLFLTAFSFLNVSSYTITKTFQTILVEGQPNNFAGSIFHPPSLIAG
ncbi:MAG: hypothetical protein JWM14_1254 [Chitinophagaceae bacterium]|nr:hypothetical protein [Chitinophagaceae bacterium]